MNEKSIFSAEGSKLFLDLLERASTPTLLPMLSAKQRWRLVLEVLLGHGPIRGGRTRDYPFSQERAQSTKMADLLARTSIGFRPGIAKRVVSITVYDLLVAIQCIEASNVMTSLGKGWTEEEHFTVAMRALLKEIFPGAVQSSILDALGISHSGSEGATSKVKAYESGVMLLGKRMAALCATPIPQEYPNSPVSYLTEYFELRPQDVDALSKGRMSLVYLKTKGAQTFIDRCHTPFIQRGASFWCSQTSARIRDHFIDDPKVNRSLLLDNDAVTIIVGSADEDQRAVERAVRRYLFDADDGHQVSIDFFAKNYPRLIPYYDAARSEGIATAAVLPAIGLQVRYKSLFDLVVDRSVSGFKAMESECVVKVADCDFAGEDPIPCSGRQGDFRIRDRALSVPTWYNPGRENEGYGFPSIAFSLAGLTYAKVGGGAVAAQLREHAIGDLRSVATQKELLEKTQSPDGRLTYLKFDGDGFGTLFSGVPSLRRPSLSIEIESLMRESWISANLAVMKAHGTSVTPSDLIYFGGDDILATIPSHLLHSFLEHFDEALFTKQPKPNKVRFTFAALTFATKSAALEGEDALGLSISKIGEVNKLLKDAKDHHKSGKSFNAEEYTRWGDVLQWKPFRVTQGLQLG